MIHILVFKYKDAERAERSGRACGRGGRARRAPWPWSQPGVRWECNQLPLAGSSLKARPHPCSRVYAGLASSSQQPPNPAPQRPQVSTPLTLTIGCRRLGLSDSDTHEP